LTQSKRLLARPASTCDLPAILWVGVPIASLAVGLLTPLLGYPAWLSLMMGEFGFLEQATVVFLVAALVFWVLILRRRRSLPVRVRWVMVLGGLAAIFFLGEEISWGQHYLRFTPPAAVVEINRKDEFNLHNIEGVWGNLFNNFPRQVMLLGCLVVGVVVPLVLRPRVRRIQDPRSFWFWVIPTRRLVPICLLAVFSTVPEHILNQWYRVADDTYLGMAFVDSAGEFKEYCYAFVILLYFWSLWRRLPRLARSVHAENDAPDVFRGAE